MQRATFLLLVGLVGCGCGVDAGPATCVENETAVCSCIDGSVGSQTCATGIFQPCMCGSAGGEGGFAGFAGTSGAGGVGGSGGDAGTGGTGGDAGTGGAGGDAGTGGAGGDAGTGGVGGSAGDAGTGGTAGTAGDGGTGGAEGGAVWSRCDVGVDSECAEGMVCYRAAGLSDGPGFCTNECSESSECSQISGAAVRASCGSEGVCRFTCAIAGCPLGMTCSSLGRCNYQN